MNLSNQPEHADVIKTQHWIERVIVGFNFCPFAKKELLNNRIYYHVSHEQKVKLAVKELIEQCYYLIEHPNIETSLVLYPDHFKDFYQYLSLVDAGNEAIEAHQMEGVFQLASFHPDYCFEGESFDDPSNYTNRSPCPTLHIIREESMEKVLNLYKDPESIPENNIRFAREKGADFFKAILANL